MLHPPPVGLISSHTTMFLPDQGLWLEHTKAGSGWLTEKSMFFLSWLTARGSGTGSVCLMTDTDSPVEYGTKGFQMTSCPSPIFPIPTPSLLCQTGPGKDKVAILEGVWTLEETTGGKWEIHCT